MKKTYRKKLMTALGISGSGALLGAAGLEAAGVTGGGVIGLAGLGFGASALALGLTGGYRKE